MAGDLPPALARVVRRQAAAIVAQLLVRRCAALLRPVLTRAPQAADAAQRGGASLKTLTLAPGVRAKAATHAVCCETLKCAVSSQLRPCHATLRSCRLPAPAQT